MNIVNLAQYVTSPANAGPPPGQANAMHGGHRPISNNEFNSPVDGFVGSMVYGGITGKMMGSNVFGPGGGMGAEGIQVPPQVKMMLKSGATNAGIGALVYGGMSILQQSVGVMKGHQTSGAAMANVTTDLAAGAAAGLGATLGGGLTALASKALGATGTLGIVLSVAGGMLGAAAGSTAVELTGLRGTLLDKFNA